MKTNSIFISLLIVNSYLFACGHNSQKISTTKNCSTAHIRGQNQAINPETRQILEQANIDPAKIRCNTNVVWHPDLDTLSKNAAKQIEKEWALTLDEKMHHQGARIVLGNLVRLAFQLQKTNNFGAMQLKDRYYTKDGKKYPLLIFRSSIMTDAKEPNSCLRSLLQEANVKHVVNLYAGAFPLFDFIEEETQTATKMGVTYNNEADQKRKWRNIIENSKDYSKNFVAASKLVAELINKQILYPQGKKPVGNILIHCGGGMHRTGMIYGIIRRCINNISMDKIEKEYKYHTAYKSDQFPGGYESLNVRFIREFDCSLLER